MKMFQSIHINWRNSSLIQNLYMEQKIKVRVKQGYTSSVRIGRGVPQGMLPILFNLLGEWFVNVVLEDTGNILIGERKVTTIKYADDLVVKSRTKSSMWVEDTENYDNAKKMRIERCGLLQILGKHLDQRWILHQRDQNLFVKAALIEIREVL